MRVRRCRWVRRGAPRSLGALLRLHRLGHVVDRVYPVIETAAEVLRLGRALAKVLLHEQVVLIVRGQLDFAICPTQHNRARIRRQLHLALLLRVLEVPDEALHVQLEAPLLLDPESVFLEQQACQDGLARLHQGIFELW